MSEQKHTPEPWAAYQDGKIEFGNINHFIKSLAGDLISYGHLSKDDARRIVACVNACAGISTENLEDNKPLIELAMAYNVALRQRDELLAAAEAIEIDAEECLDFDECTGMFVPIDTYHKLMEAIASVKGSAA